MQSETQRNWNNYFNNKKPKKKPPIALIIFILLIFISIIIGTNTTNNNSTTHKNIDISNLNSNRNGKIMQESIHTISKIFQNLENTKDDKTIETYINTINETDLSIEYTDFKNDMIQKIRYYQQFITTKESKYAELFNSINYITELAKAFDKAKVTYEISNDNHIYFWVK